jgi:hypothetical protein
MTRSEKRQSDAPLKNKIVDGETRDRRPEEADEKTGGS